MIKRMFFTAFYMSAMKTIYFYTALKAEHERLAIFLAYSDRYKKKKLTHYYTHFEDNSNKDYKRKTKN